MILDASPLYDLLLALFEDESELRRFLSLVSLEDVEHRLPATKGGSMNAAALEASRAIEELGRANRALFEALARRAPERAADVWEVAAHYGVGQVESAAASVAETASPEAEPSRSFSVRQMAEAEGGGGSDAAAMGLGAEADEDLAGPGAELPPPPGSAAVADTGDVGEYAEFVRELESALDTVMTVNEVEPALDPARWPWTAAAAVLGGFRPSSLRPLPEDTPPADSALTALSHAVFTAFDGRWVLVDAVRSSALARLHEQRQLELALDANTHLADPERDWIRQLLTAEPPGLATLDAAQLNALDLAMRWLEPLPVNLPLSRASVYASLERRRLIDPLRALVGNHFRGRSEEVARIGRHIGGESDTAVLLLHGPGGTGKSSLLGKVLLDLEDKLATEPVSFAYIDFDKGRHDPNKPSRLLEQIARQLRLLYATSAEESRAFAALESSIGGTDVGYAAEVLNLDAEVGRLDPAAFIDELSARLHKVARSSTPLVLVFDTFEEVQLQGPGPVKTVVDLIDRFHEALPGVRVIVSGRGSLDISGWDGPVDDLTLGDLDPSAADAVLQHLGVRAPELRTLVVERFGGNPLTLRLASEALKRLGSADEAFGDVVVQADVLAELASEQVQGMLYSRILRHIGDPEIANVAHPGLAVRRVDADVVREVLAGPCQLDPSRADEIVARLRREVSLFELQDDGSLRHREDVRRLMMRTMMDDKERAATVEEIHRLAIDFYARREGPVARAEEIYHRLVRNEDPRTFLHKWSPELRKSLASALEEPLRPRAREWLARRLGRISGEDRGQWAQEEWEMGAAEQAESWLASRDPEQALDVLGERAERSLGSPLYVLEVNALLQLERLDEAAAVIDRGLRNAIDAGDRSLQISLAELSTKVAVKRNDPAAIVSATSAAIRLSDLAGERERSLDLLCKATDELRRLGDTDKADALAGDVARRFGQVPADRLREKPELVRDVLRSAGPTESTVVVRAATELGDALLDRVFRDDSFAVTRLLEQTSSEGRPQLSRLAEEVGLTSPSWTTRDLARSLTQSGRVGQAVLVGLDFATDESAARQLVVNELVHRAGPSKAY